MSSDAALNPVSQTESIFEAIVSNTPGLVCCFHLDPDNRITITYLSDGCKALLGLEKEELIRQPHLFLEMIVAQDRKQFFSMTKRSAKKMQVLNWEGRIWVEEWQDIKWLNLRASPRKLGNGVMQWAGFMTNITQSKNEKFEIAQSRKRLAEMSAHMNHIKEEERKRISREIHDDVGGNLTAIKMGISTIIHRLGPGQEALREKAQHLEGIIDATFDAVHRIASDLRPNILELGIVEALDWQAKEFEKQMGIPCKFISNKDDVKLEPDQEAALYRICQEAMSNIAKHANASSVLVTLESMPQQITMQISDNGTGIQPDDGLKPNSFGVRGMAERVVALDGSFNIEAGLHGGTLLTIKLPVVEITNNSMRKTRRGAVRS